MFMPLPGHEVGVVVALAAEAVGFSAASPGVNQPVGEDRIQVAVAGIGHQRAEAASRLLVDRGARLLVSWGTAAGLSAELRAGDILLPRCVVAGDREWLTDATWRGCFERALSPGRRMFGGRLWCSQSPIASPEMKARLASQDLMAADMESAAVAAVAGSARLPFVAIKVICDPASREVPGVALGMVGVDGHVTWRGLPAVLRAGPSAWRSMLALRGDFAIARRTLKRAAQALSR